ncbi:MULTISPECIES: LacI family DNA-binding transcriptional regulator [Tepidanaerobacter]|mgnify:CR=1 FL=1|uniref:LacI family transcriptional regulator n=1 Tax=Tepidanaerobacter syntrophicus TaxID=224999 RepID=A0A0U9HLC8_9FIRM|nr:MULTISPECIES: LacI family DNA-binding transcriptional regulator [Tepidanaerobacter]GAQ24625.1 LacI family transcriptional regulator [Tepidanaerobacter syntrophicus]GLI19798.1 LacI family transcriptional regulator [Tepidanaerobacter syntrophicus]GLI51821.1 LacI family transcriptional regulator [Tepidanaerobacter syntrophicus]HHV83259.1 LacI family transcriptional regulator [Tepidanaerobacter syntrophicus]
MVTIKEVAKKAGVSPSTVSRVLNGSDVVAEDTKEKVMAAVKSLNYRPNFLAQGLKDGKTKTIGLIIPNIRNPIYPVIARGVEDVARKYGYTVILCNTDEDTEIEKESIQKLRKRWVDGLIIAPAAKKVEHLEELEQEGFPMVVIVRKLDIKANMIVIDNFQAAYDAVSFLIKTGHRRIAIVKGNQQLALYRDRFSGYKQALLDAGIPIEYELITGDDSDSIQWSLDGYNAVNSLLNRNIEFDAVFATTDLRAIGAIRAIKDHNLRVPDDISVIGFDNLEFSSLIDPPLSTVSQPFYDIGARAASKVLQLCSKDNPSGAMVEIMPSELIIRKSTR